MMRWLLAALMALMSANALAVEAVPVGDAPVTDLKPSTEIYLDQPDRLQVSTAPDINGVVQRIEVTPTHEGTRHWAVIGLRNPGDEQLDRLLVAQHHRLAGSGVLNPDLGSVRIVGITPSEGFPPQRVPSTEADAFLITLDPGATVTFVLELGSDSLPMLRLWEPNSYRDSQNAYTLFKGIIVGIAGLMALFFLAMFVIKGTMMFAAAAVLAWVCFGYVLIDFAFLADIVATRLASETALRAFSEAMLVMALAAFILSYLQITRWRLRNTSLMVALIVLTVGAGWLSFQNPVLTAQIARQALPLVAAGGLVAIVIAAIGGNERAIMILPTWVLLIGWIAAAGLTVTGEIDNDFVQPALNGGLVLLVLLIGFTVMQHAFAGTTIAPALAKNVERDVLALAGAGDIVWDWDLQRDHITCGAEAEARLGMERGALQGPPQDWFPALHPQDRDRFRAVLDATTERRRGRINDIFRFRGVDGHFRWFRLRARPVIGTDGEIIRCVGTLTDVTEAKTVEERLLHDSVYDNLTGLPNQALFLDRIEMARAWSNEQTAQKLFVCVVNPDNFSEINDQYGQSVGDSVLLTMARRLGRILRRHDSVSRLSGDSFGLLVYSDPNKLDDLSEKVRAAMGTPIPFADEEIVVVCSLGVAGIDLKAENAAEILDNAELALRRAKRQGGDRAEVFDPLMRRLNMSGRSLARDLKRAIAEDKVKLQFRPVMDFETGKVTGYEAVPSWQHPLQGPLSWSELLEVASHENMALQMALATLDRCAQTLGEWHASGNPLTLMVPLPIAEAFRSELVGDMKTIIARARIEPGMLQLGIPEKVVTDNPEFCVQLVTRLRDVGASVWLVDFARRTSAPTILSRLAIDGVRFDEGLTRLGEKPRPDKLVAAMFGVANALNAKVMVGGIETEEQAAKLKALGADLGVGPVFGRAVTSLGKSKKLQTQQAAE